MSGSVPVGRDPSLQEEIKDVEKPEAERRGCWELREARLLAFPASNGSCTHPKIITLGYVPPYRSLLVAQGPNTDDKPLLQGVSEVEGPADDPVARRCRIIFLYGNGKAGAGFRGWREGRRVIAGAPGKGR